MDVDDLKKIGFAKIGAWVMEEDRVSVQLVSGDQARLLAAANALYAFAEAQDVRYLGKTTQTVRRRFYGYASPAAGQSTNIRCNRNIRDALQDGGCVEIYVYVSNAGLNVGGFELNMAAGLEDSLIAAFQPSWNGRDRGRILTETAEIEREKVSPPDDVVEIQHEECLLVVQPYYHQNGVLNLRPNVSTVLGAHGETLKLNLSGNAGEVYTLINRTANKNGSVRLRGPELKKWLRGNFSVDEQICVRAISANELGLWKAGKVES